MSAYSTGAFLRANEDERLKTTFCNYCALGQFECARGVMFRLYRNDSSLALQLLESMIQRQYPTNWLCSQEVKSSAHIAWLCLTLRHELLHGVEQTVSDDKFTHAKASEDSGSKPKRRVHAFEAASGNDAELSGRGSQHGVAPHIRETVLLGCNVSGLEFDVLLADCLVDVYALRRRVNLDPCACISYRCCQELRQVVYSSSETTQHIRLPFLTLYGGSASSPPHDVTQGANFTGDLLPNLVEEQRRGLQQENNSNMKLSSGALTFLGALLVHVHVVPTIEQLITSVCQHLAKLGSHVAIAQVIEQCTGAVAAALHFAGGVQQQLKESVVVASLRCLSSVFGVWHDMHRERKVKSTSSDGFDSVPATVKLLLRAVVHLFYSSDLAKSKHKDDSQAEEVIGHHMLSSATFADLVRAVPASVSSLWQQYLETKSMDAHDTGTPRNHTLRLKVYETLLTSSDFILLRLFSYVAYCALCHVPCVEASVRFNPILTTTSTCYIYVLCM